MGRGTSRDVEPSDRTPAKPGAGPPSGHLVGVFSEQAAPSGPQDQPGSEEESGQRQVGGGAARRAAVTAAVGAAGGAVVIGGATWLLTDVGGSAIAGATAGGAVLVGALSGLWGAFSSMGWSDDWRRAPGAGGEPGSDPEPARPGSQPVAGSADDLTAKGAMTVYELDDESPQQGR